MASDDDDRRRLLDSDDGESSTSDLRRRKTQLVRGVTDVVVDGSGLLGDDDLTAGGSYSNRLRTIGDNDYVVAVFVIAFDTKAGLTYFTYEMCLIISSYCYVKCYIGVNVKCYIGVCYRTPTADINSSQYHDLLQDVIRELGSTKKHFMLMGDCNYRFLSWPPHEDNNDISRAAGEFCECLDDNFFTQHVTVPTLFWIL